MKKILVFLQILSFTTCFCDDVPNIKIRNDIPQGGDWIIDSYRYTFNSDGTCLANTDIHGTWVVKKNKFIATWDNGFIDTYDIPGNGKEFNGVNQDGRKLIMKKNVPNQSLKGRM